MQTRQKRFPAFASAAVALAMIGCGDISTGTAPSGTDDQTVETRAAALTAPPSRVLDPNTRFFIPPPPAGAVKQVVDLVKGRKLLDAARITAMASASRGSGAVPSFRAAVRKYSAALSTL